MKNLLLALRTVSLHCSVHWSQTYCQVWFPAMSAVLLDWEARMPNLHIHWTMEWLQCISSPLCARPSFRVNWGSPLASSEAMLTCTSQESAPWFSKPDSWGCLLTLEVLWGLWDEHCSKAPGGKLILAKRDQAEPCLEFGLLWSARSGDHSPFLAGLSCHAHVLAACGLMWPGLPALLALGPCGLGSCDSKKKKNLFFNIYFLSKKTYLSANWVMQGNTGLKKQKMWTREWISFLLKHLLAKMPLFVILQVLALTWIKQLLLASVAECSALAKVNILSCFPFSFPFFLPGVMFSVPLLKSLAHNPYLLGVSELHCSGLP